MVSIIMRSRSTRHKVTSLIALLTLIGLVMGIGLGYYAGFNLLRNTLAKNHQEMAEILAQSVSETISEKIGDIEGYIGSPGIRNAIHGRNMEYGKTDESELRDYFMTKDEEWSEAGEKSIMLTSYLDNEASLELKRLTGTDSTMGEIFVTDRFGGLVASSGKTSDFYQADEEWWQGTLNDGRGRIYIGDIEFDESSSIWGISIAIPVRADDGSIIGICKVVLDTKAFFGPLQNFKIAKTGHAFLIDGKGRVLFHPHVRPLSVSIFDQRDISSILEAKQKWQVIDELKLYEKEMFTVFALVRHPILMEKEMAWAILVNQEAREVFAPLRAYLVQGGVLTGLLLATLLPLGFYFAGIYARPIKKLREATDAIAAGDLDYEVDIKTGDEIEILAISFNRMTRKVKALIEREKELVNAEKRKSEELRNAYDQIHMRTDELQEAKSKLESWSKSLEERVKERTRALTDTQKGTLNMMEDLQEAYVKLKEAQNQLIQAGKMEAIGRMASGVAHEVKNPLGIIMQGINYLEGKKSPGEKDEAEIIGIIKENIRRADNIVRALGDFSKAKDLCTEPEDINSLLEKSLALIKHRTKLENIKIVKELKKSLPRVSADKGKMEQVFVNIFLNATHAMPNGGILFIRSYSKKMDECAFRVGRRNDGSDYFEIGETAVVAEVEDTGVGISEANMKRIFDPFFTTKGTSEGTGLGLSVTRSIVDMHRGILDVKSREGKGTRVTITLKAIGGVGHG